MYKEIFSNDIFLHEITVEKYVKIWLAIGRALRAEEVHVRAAVSNNAKYNKTGCRKLDDDNRIKRFLLQFYIGNIIISRRATKKIPIAPGDL